VSELINLVIYGVHELVNHLFDGVLRLGDARWIYFNAYRKLSEVRNTRYSLLVDQQRLHPKQEAREGQNESFDGSLVA